MQKYRKKPVVIEAVQWTGKNVDQLLSFANSGPHPLWGSDFRINTQDQTVHVFTREGMMTGNVGDWIIKGVQGEFYPCKPDIFATTYEAVECEHEWKTDDSYSGKAFCRYCGEYAQPS